MKIVKMESETQKNVSDFSNIKPAENKGIDLNKYKNEQVEIEKAEVIQVPSTFTEQDENGNHYPQWVLKVSSKVLETLGEGEDKVEFRASELFNLIQEKGELKNFPKGEGSNLYKFVTDLGIDISKLENLQEVIDAIKEKKAVVKAYNKTVEGNEKTYLKFKY